MKSRRWWLLGTLVAVLIVGAYAAAATAAAGRTGRTADYGQASADRWRDTDWSGLTENELSERLAVVAASAEEPVTVRVAGVSDEVIPSQAGLSLDVDATARRATAMSWNPVVVWSKLVSGQHIEPVTRVDQPALRAIVDDLAAHVDADPVNGAVRIVDAEPEVTQAEDGRELVKDTAAARLAAHWSASSSIELDAETTHPQITADEVQRVLAEQVEPALAEPITVQVSDTDAELAVADFAPTLSVAARDEELQLLVDGDRLRRVIVAQSPGLVRKPRDASIAIVDGAPKITPAKQGVALDDTAVSHAVLPVLAEEDPAARKAAVDVVVAEPEVSTQQIEALGITEVIADFSVPAHGPWGRTENIRVAAQRVNGTVLAPGETFSLNHTVGERTTANGFHTAPVIEDGRLVAGLGGGVSQVATTLFNGMFFAGLEDVEHHPHSIYFSRYPEGREATVAWGAKDLRFRNDSEHGVLIQLYLADGQLRTTFWGTKTWDIESVKGPRYNFRAPGEFESASPRCVRQSPKQGFDVNVTRVFRRGGAEVRRETFSTQYNPEDKITCVEPGQEQPAS